MYALLQSAGQQRTLQLSPCLMLWLLLASARAETKILLKSTPLSSLSKWQFNEALHSDVETGMENEAGLLLPITASYSQSQVMPFTQRAASYSLGCWGAGPQSVLHSQNPSKPVPAVTLLEPGYSPEVSSSHLREMKKQIYNRDTQRN